MPPRSSSQEITIRYRDHGGIPTPVVELTISYRSRRLKIEAIVDSGASCSVFRREYAAYLGLPAKDAKVTKTALASGKETEVLTFPGLWLRGKLGPNDFPLVPFFHKEQNPNAPDLLGRIDFFDAFKVIVDERNREIKLLPNPQRKKAK